jgi:hypothetical protein
VCSASETVEKARRCEARLESKERSFTGSDVWRQFHEIGFGRK